MWTGDDITGYVILEWGLQTGPHYPFRLWAMNGWAYSAECIILLAFLLL